MRRTRVKICGITRPDDAVAAAAAGADAIGMIFYAPAPRNISLERARAILRVLPPFVTPVGLFVDTEVDEVLRVSGALHLRHVQLHGHEPPRDVAALRGLQVVKGIRVDETFGETLATWRSAANDLNLVNLRGIVLETGQTSEAGGSGVANDWDAVERQRKAGAFDGLPPLIAAGGLTPESVGGVVRRVRPWAVDVSSGVENTRGIKSVEKLQQFVRAVHEADAEIDASK